MTWKRPEDLEVRTHIMYTLKFYTKIVLYGTLTKYYDMIITYENFVRCIYNNYIWNKLNMPPHPHPHLRGFHGTNIYSSISSLKQTRYESKVLTSLCHLKHSIN